MPVFTRHKLHQFNTMPTRKHPDWIDWRKAAARKIILDDSESGRLSLLAEEISAEEAWLTRCKDLPVFVGPPRVVFSQFKERLAGHRKQVAKKKEQEENGSFGTARAPKNPDWIDWKNSDARRIILEDLETFCHWKKKKCLQKMHGNSFIRTCRSSLDLVWCSVNSKSVWRITGNK